MRTWLAGLADNDALVARLTRIAIWVVGIAALIFILDLLGVPVSDWIRELFKKIREVPAWAVIAGVSLQTVQTTLAAFAWLTILRAAFPRARITFRLVLASYAVSVAMNSFLPANIGTFVMLVMFTTVIAGATFAAIFSGYRRAEDPVHDLQRRRLPLPLPLGRGLVLDQAQRPGESQGPRDPPHRGIRSSCSF